MSAAAGAGGVLALLEQGTPPSGQRCGLALRLVPLVSAGLSVKGPDESREMTRCQETGPPVIIRRKDVRRVDDP
jgi:hypothetical protein